MIRGIGQDELVEMLLNTLEGERYVRRALLEELCDALGDTPAAAQGRDLFRLVDDNDAFARGLKLLRAHVEECPVSRTLARTHASHPGQSRSVSSAA